MMEDLQMPEDTADSSSSKLPLIAIIIGAFGIIVGVAGIVMANGAQSAVREMENRIETLPNPADDLRTEMDALEKRMGEKTSGAVSRVTDLESQLVRVREQTQAAFTSISREIRENREQLNSLSRELKKVDEALKDGVPSASARSSSSSSYSSTSSSGSSNSDSESGSDSGSSGGGSSGGSEASGGVYRIQSGDTLTKVANRYGTTVDAIMRINPGVNPRKLQIGQEIVIPEE